MDPNDWHVYIRDYMQLTLGRRVSRNFDKFDQDGAM